MEFGFTVTIQQPPDGDPRENFELTERLAGAVSDYGFDSLWKGQHFLSNLINFQPVPLLGRLSGTHPDFTYGNIVLLPLDHPVRTAEYAANLDVLTNGNYICGVALGYRDVEFDSLGIPKNERVGRLVEGIEILRKLWTEESVTYDGEYFALEDVSISAKPVQEGGPPIWIAANVDAAVRRAARIGDAWFINPHTRMEKVEQQIEMYNDELESHGKDPESVTLPLYREALVAEDTDEAIKAAAPHLSEKYNEYVDWGQSEAMGDSGDLTGEFEELLEDRFLLGSPERVRKQVERYESLGVDHLVLRMYWPGMKEETCLKSIRLFGEEIIPTFE